MAGCISLTLPLKSLLLPLSRLHHLSLASSSLSCFCPSLTLFCFSLSHFILLWCFSFTSLPSFCFSLYHCFANPLAIYLRMCQHFVSFFFRLSSFCLCTLPFCFALPLWTKLRNRTKILWFGSAVLFRVQFGALLDDSFWNRTKSA